MRQDYDEFDGASSPRSKAAWIVMGLAAISFAALGIYAINGSGSEDAGEDIITLDAVDSAYKTTPENEGGMEFPHQDKTIYDALDGNTQRAQVERLYPEPETPIIPEVDAEDVVPESAITKENGAAESYVANAPKEEAPEPSKPRTSAIEKAQQQAKALADEAVKNAAIPKPTPEVKPAPIVSEKPAPVVSKKPESTPAPTPAPVEKPAPKPEAKPVKQAPVLAGKFAVQLGAYKSQPEAEGQWQKIYTKHMSALSGTREKIIRADLAGGTYYRLRAVGFASAESAKAACGKLSAAGQACFFAGQQ